MSDERKRKSLETLDYFTPRPDSAPEVDRGPSGWGCLGWMVALMVCGGISYGLTVLYWMSTFRLFSPATTLETIGFYVVILSPFAALLIYALWRAPAEPPKQDDRSICPTCGYDLRGTPDRCPECGTAVTPRGGVA